MIEYRLDLYNRERENVFTLPATQLHSFTYSKFLNTGGHVEVRMHNLGKFIAQFDLPEHLDFMWKIRRRDTLFQTKLEVDQIGLHRGLQHNQLNDGNYLNYSYGVSLNDLLMTEATDLTNYEKSGVVSAVAIEYAKDLLAQFPSITFLGVKNPKPHTWEGDRRYKKLVTILNELAEIDNAYYLINSNFKFEWFYATDNNITVHSGLGHIKNLRVVKNYVDVATHATTIGAGVDDLRLRDTEYLPEFYQQYGEFYYNHVVRTGSGKTIPSLASSSIAILQERLRAVNDIEFKVIVNNTFVYKRDFDIGHILTVDFFGIKYKVIVHSVYVTRTKLGIDTVLVGCKYVNS